MVKKTFYRVGNVRGGKVTSSLVMSNGRRVVTINRDTYNRAKTVAAKVLKGIKYD